MHVLTQAGLVALGSVFGGLLRWGVGLTSVWLFGRGFPWGTLIINLTSCVFLGWFMTVLEERLVGGWWRLSQDHLRLLIAVGFTGTYSTFSTFEYETQQMFRVGEKEKASLYLFGSVFLGLVAVWLGVQLAKLK